MSLDPSVVLPLTYLSFTGQPTPGPGAFVQPSVILGQHLSTAAAEDGVRYLITSEQQALGLFGVGSTTYWACRAFLRNAPTAELYAISLEAPTGAVAERDITFTGPATGAGSIVLRIGGRAVTVPVADGDSATDIATAAAAAINAAGLIVEADNTAGVLEITSRATGTVHNGLAITVNSLGAVEEPLPAGVGVSPAITSLASGTGAVDPADWVSAMGDDGYDVVVIQSASTDNLNALRAELTRRWGPTVQLQGTAFAAVSLAPSVAITTAGQRNDQHLSLVNAPVADGWTSPLWELAAALAGVAAREKAIAPGRPLQTLPLADIVAGTAASFADRNLMARAGIVTLTSRAGVARIEADTTTYRTTPLGASDGNWFYLKTPFVLQRLGRRIAARIQSRFPRHSLAADGTQVSPTLAVTTPSQVKGEIVAELADIESDGLIQSLNAWINDIIVQIAPSDPNRLEVAIPARLIGQLRVVDIDTQFTG